MYQNDGNLCDQVDNFSGILRTCSIDCDVASYYLHKDITNWNVCIQQCIKYTKCILLVCTKELLERLNGQFQERIEMTRSSGPYILSTALQCLLETKPKILPIIVDKQSMEYIPAYLRSIRFPLGLFPMLQVLLSRILRKFWICQSTKILKA